MGSAGTTLAAKVRRKEDAYEKEEPDESVEVGLGCFECHFDPVPVELFFVNVHACCTVGIEAHASERPVLLFVIQKTCCGRSVRHEEVACNPKHYRRRALD